MGRLKNTMGASPAVLVTTAAVTLTSLSAGVLGLWPGGTTENSTAPVLAPQAGAVDSPASVTARSAPARDVITELLGEDPRWGAVVPTGFGCTVPAPVLSAEADGVTVHVFGPGLGGTVAERVADCGSRARVSDTTATVLRADSGRVTAWTRGDVLVTVATAGAPGPVATDLDQRLLAALDGACLDLDPTSADARRNPTQGQYAPYTEKVTVQITPAPDAPDVGPAPAAPAAPAPARSALPAGLAGPQLPAPLERPAAPVWPGPQELSTEVDVPSVDRDGPGCGWDFTGAVAPVVDQAAVRAARTQLTEQARTELQTRQEQWLTAAAAYLPALESYTTAVTAWDGYRQHVSAVTESWAEQTTALAAYRQAVAERDQALGAMETYLTTRDAAQATYDAAVAACQRPAVPAPDPVSADEPATTDPTVEAEPQRRPTGCVTPPQRPQVLDQPAPTVPVEPVAPRLWQPGDPVPGLEGPAAAHP